MRKFGIFILSFILLVNYLVITPFAEVMIANNDNNSVEERQEIASQIPPIETEKNTEIVDTDVILDSNIEETLSKQESKEKKKRDVIKEESEDIASGIQGTAPWRIDSEGTLRIGGGKISATSGKDRTWTPYELDIKKIIFENKVTSSVNIDGLFKGLKNVKKIENISYLDTSGAAYLSYMFMDMESLEALDLSSWNVSNSIDTMGMFANTHSLKNLNISNWNVSKVTNMDSMFWYCGHSVGLTSLEISNWDVSNVTNMRYMFRGINLSSLDLSDWDVSKVSNMSSMFTRAKFKQLDLSAWNPLESRNANQMFFDLPFLSQIKLGSYFNFVGTEDLSKNYSDKWRNVGLGTEEMPQGANTWTSKQLMQNYDGSKDADTYIWINELEVETKTADIPLGTNVSDINPQDFIESVKLEGVKLSENEYTTKVTNNPKTTQVGSRTIKIEVTPKVDELKKVEVEEAINIVWGSTLVAKDVTQTSTDASISLLHNKISGKPILNANEGNGFSSAIERLTVRPILNIYRSREENLILRAHYNTIYTPQEDLAQRWNGLFSKTEINYGDVVGFQVLPDDPDESYSGKNTFVSRNNELVTETVGYEWAYYELTTSGYRLMHFNQLIINNDQKVKLNTSKEEMNRNISNFIILPKHIENPNDFRMEFASVDTTSSGNKKSTINVYETLKSGGEFKTTYEVAYTVDPEVLDVQSKPANVSLGTNISDIDPNVFIESVKLGDVELSKNEYTVKIKNSPNTMMIGSQQFSLEVTPEYNTSLAQNITVDSNIVWGSTLVIKDNGLGRVDASVSLLHKNGSPYLNANQGSGFSGTTLTSRPDINVYRNSEAEHIFRAFYGSVGNTPAVLAKNWNAIFQENEVKYGDVLKIYVNKWNGGGNWKGNNTFISRNNTLITETVGYDYAYYELTPSGYRLLRLNQLVVNNNQKVKLNTSKEEMNKNISNYISLPEHIENPNHYRMEFESVDTTSSGNKKSTINVYETLESGGEFKTTYEVTYTVNPEVTESYYDVNGKQIEQSQTTEFNYGQEFTPNPEEYIENNGELYIYKGWVDALPGTGTIIPQEEVPEATKVEKNYYYIYDKADKFINVTLPTEVIFGTFENNNKISSKAYEIKNNSEELPIEVSLERFDKVKSDIKLLSSDVPDPTQEEASAKLNLCVDNDRVIPGLTEATPTQSVTKIDTNASRVISLEGTYFGNMSDKNILDYKMHLKFKATQDNKN